ncbi:MAG: STAS domain-containing protein [Pirellulales bacterium]|nr:STAS domain-containing protein [Pirellulales bacterium]
MLAIAPGWELDVQRGPDWLIVTLDGSDPERDDSPPLADRIWSLMEQHLTHRLVLKLQEVPILTSHLIGQLIDLYRRIREFDGVMRLCGLSAYNRRVLHTCHLDDRLPAYDNLHEAVLGYAAPRKPR